MSDLTSNPVSKEMRDCFQGTIDQYSGQTHYVDCWRDHWPCALARTLDEIDRLTRREAELVKALERLAQRRDRHHDCGDYERGYGDAEASASAIARAALKEPTT